MNSTDINKNDTVFNINEKINDKNNKKHPTKTMAENSLKGIVESANIETIDSYLNGDDWRVKANANVQKSHAGLLTTVSAKAVANVWGKYFGNKHKTLHENGFIHIHDLDYLGGYCAGWSLRNLLNVGFGGVDGAVSASPPIHLYSAVGQIVNFLGVIQQEWAGAQAFSSFDTFLAPYVFMDDLSYDRVKQEIKSLVYSLNVVSRFGQAPFTNITLDFKVPNDLRSQIPTYRDEHLFSDSVLSKLSENQVEDIKRRTKLKGKENPTDLTYSDFEDELLLITAAYYDVLNKGDDLGRAFTFPIPTVNITEDFDWSTDAASKLLDNTRKYGNSYFQNFIGSQYMLDSEGNKVKNPLAYSPDAVRSMCCRLQLDLNELKKRGGGLFGSDEMTGSLGVVTINLAKLGYLVNRYYNNDKNKLIEFVLDLVRSSSDILEIKRKEVQRLYDEVNLYAYTKVYLKTYKNHFSTVGVNGGHEMLLNLGIEGGMTSKKGRELTLEILKAIREELKIIQEDTKTMYNLEATPSESATYRFAKVDKELHPGIIHSGSGENIYYTNSTQHPVDADVCPFKVLDEQDELQIQYTGGTVYHVYHAEDLANLSNAGMKNFLMKILSNYKLPYVSISPIFSICPEHGYFAGKHPKCPTCGGDTEEWTRVMGYHRPKQNYNKGKTGEHNDRTPFKIK